MSTKSENMTKTVSVDCEIFDDMSNLTTSVSSTQSSTDSSRSPEKRTRVSLNHDGTDWTKLDMSHLCIQRKVQTGQTHSQISLSYNLSVPIYSYTDCPSVPMIADPSALASPSVPLRHLLDWKVSTKCAN